MPSKKKVAKKRGAKPRSSSKPPRTPKAAVADKPRGRPSTYSPEIGRRVCEHIMLGVTLRQIAGIKGMPDKATIIRWLADEEKYKDFCDQYARAREVQAEVMADDMMDIAEDSRNDWVERENARTGETYVALNDEAIARSRTRIETRKWLMGKMKPKRFGDRVAVTGKDGGPIRHAHSALSGILDEIDGSDTGLPAARHGEGAG